jgi:NTE family protein
VLEGGGVLGLAHVGVISAIEALGIPIDIVVGTSMGAMSAVGRFRTGNWRVFVCSRYILTTPMMGT